MFRVYHNYDMMIVCIKLVSTFGIPSFLTMGKNDKLKPANSIKVR
jgi:hypothetical protein